MKNKLCLGIASIAFIILFAFSLNVCGQGSNSGYDKFKMFVGEWKLKGDIWKSSFDSVYKEEVNPKRSFVAKAVAPENAILWNVDFGDGGWAVLFWTYHAESGRVNYISNTPENNVGVGVGEFKNNNNDLEIKIVYPNGCTSCHRIYSYHWISPTEFDFKATIYKDDKPTGDFYGCSFLRKK